MVAAVAPLTLVCQSVAPCARRLAVSGADFDRQRGALQWFGRSPVPLLSPTSWI